MFYTKKIINIKSFVENEITCILMDNTLDLQNKQVNIERFLFKNLKNFPLIEDSNYYEEFCILRNKIYDIDFEKEQGKTFFKQFFRFISQEAIKDLLLYNFLYNIRYFTHISANFLRNEFLKIIKNYLIEKNHTISIPRKKIIEKCTSYIIEILKYKKIIYFDTNLNIYKLTNCNFLLIDATFLANNQWPLIIKPLKYSKQLNKYFGGYYEKKLQLDIENERIKPIILKDNFINLINKIQNIPYYLNTNKNIVNLFLKYIVYLENSILEFEKNRNLIILKKLRKFKDYHFDDNLDLFLQNWHTVYQFLLYNKNNIIKIYFPYQVDFRGRIYNGVSFGLNPTNNKLSRLLINYGLYNLDLKSTLKLKSYIYKIIDIKSDEDFENRLENIRNLIKNNFENANFQKIKEYILLIDWIDNVIPKQKTEILIEIDASQSGFQMLSMFSNDYKCMVSTNLIKSNEQKDLYSIILNRLINVSENKDWFLILDRSFIKKIIMTIPYGSTKEGQKNMLLEKYRDKYSLKYLFYNKMDVLSIVDSKLIKDKDVYEELLLLGKDIRDSKFENITYFNERIMKLQRLIELDLLDNAFEIIVDNLTKLVKEEFYNIFDFIEKFKLNYEHLTNTDIENSNLCIETDYLQFYLGYYKIECNKINIGNVEFYNYDPIKSLLDIKQTKQSLIANLTQGLCDAFIMHKILEELIFYEKIYVYFIHDSLLLNVTDLDLVLEIINKCYNYIYKYLHKFKNVTEKEEFIYNLDSFEMFRL